MQLPQRSEQYRCSLVVPLHIAPQVGLIGCPVYGIQKILRGRDKAAAQGTLQVRWGQLVQQCATNTPHLHSCLWLFLQPPKTTGGVTQQYSGRPCSLCPPAEDHPCQVMAGTNAAQYTAVNQLSYSRSSDQAGRGGGAARTFHTSISCIAVSQLSPSLSPSCTVTSLHFLHCTVTFLHPQLLTAFRAATVVQQVAKLCWTCWT
jgi:hypothetical protein